MKKIRENLVDNHVAFVYEEICISYMWQLSADGKWNFNFDKVGKWWNNTNEIDIVAFDNVGKDIVFGECKYREAPIGTDVFILL